MTHPHRRLNWKRTSCLCQCHYVKAADCNERTCN